MRIVAILDTMWGEQGVAPKWFKINPNNHSGRRLYDLVGRNHLLVTNACRECVQNAKQHGTPDPDWLKDNLDELREKWHMDLILVCGRVAQETYVKSMFDPKGRTALTLPHPVARFTWTQEVILDTRRTIQEELKRWQDRLNTHRKDEGL